MVFKLTQQIEQIERRCTIARQIWNAISILGYLVIVYLDRDLTEDESNELYASWQDIGEMIVAMMDNDDNDNENV